VKLLNTRTFLLTLARSEPHAVGNVTNWLSLTDQYSGILAGDFNSTNDAIKDSNDTNYVFSSDSESLTLISSDNAIAFLA
jgi:hypothetical protein